MRSASGVINITKKVKEKKEEREWEKSEKKEKREKRERKTESHRRWNVMLSVKAPKKSRRYVKRPIISVVEGR